MESVNERLLLIRQYADYFSKACPSDESPESLQDDVSDIAFQEIRYRLNRFSEFYEEYDAIYTLCKLDPRVRFSARHAIEQVLSMSQVELIYLREALESRLVEIGCFVESHAEQMIDSTAETVSAV